MSRLFFWGAAFLFLLVFLPALPVRAQNPAALLPFLPTDRVLIISPHPDDETIAAGGTVQRALAAGASLRTVLLTYGENNELSFIVYKKRPVLWPQEVLAMGRMRFDEFRAATASLGMGVDALYPLGYPDYGTMDIFAKYWAPLKKPFRGMLSRRKYVPYESARSPGAAYIGNNILDELKDIILDFRPTVVIVSHPADTNRDHRAAWLFLQIALWDLEGQIEPPAVYPYLVHVPGWPRPRGFHPDESLHIPMVLNHDDISWLSLDLNDKEQRTKKDALARYTSQIRYAPTYLVSFVRKNELFGNYPVISLKRQMTSTPVWIPVGPDRPDALYGRNGRGNSIFSIETAWRGDSLRLRVQLRRPAEPETVISVSLFGYQTGAPFSSMPKLTLLASENSLHVKNQRRTIPSRGIRSTWSERSLELELPLTLLGSPDRILISARTSLFDMNVDESPWRILSLRQQTP